MATRDELYQALRNADAAGDSAGAAKLAAYIKSLPADTQADRNARSLNDPMFAGALDPTRDMSTTEKVLAGTGKAFSDLGTGVQQLGAGVADFVSPRLSDAITGQSRVSDLRNQVAETRKRDAALMRTGAGMTGNVIGNVAAMLPTAAIPGANTIAGGGAIGALSGLIQPSTSGGETITNTGIGGIAGAAIPLLIRGGKALLSAAEPFYESGKNAILGRVLERAAGSDAPAVAGRLTEASQPFTGPQMGAARSTVGEFVPGSVPTVGQAAGSPGVAALERTAVATNPDVAAQFAGRMGQQNAARVNLLSDMAGTEGYRELANADRSAVADTLYGRARAAGIPQAAMTPEAQANIAAFQSRMPDAVLNKAKELAKINGTPMDNGTSITGLHWTKMALDDLISQAKANGNGNLARAYTGLQSDFLKGIDSLSPDYAAARGAYAQMSIPINQADVAQRLLDRSVNPLTQTLQPAAYARNLNDSTARAATGFNGATLENTMNNGQMNALQSLLADVQRSNAAQNAGRGPGSDTVQKLAYSNMMEQAGIPTWLRSFAPAQVAGNVAGRAADAAYGRANRELSAKLAELMLDPGEAGALMRNAVASRNPNAILALIQKSSTPLMLGGASAVKAQQQ